MLYKNFYINQLKSVSRSKFVQDVSILQAGSMVGTFLSLISSVVFARTLNPSLYGTYSLVFAFASLVGIFMSWGTAYGALTLLAEAYSRGDKLEIRNIIV